ncbi:nucleotidyl transferase AbiEii/AbiGii toxin family protein [Phytoactinopolyspora limicola]|uniref:nucleotidyl transferase AbiEii/AbiGii toxin family protein n=1 Tax=Phytoactinopolyspora limicola TaxID=2715536 RepID=UPI00140DE29D|nr:nucleotidyl transferase AbiEii/AbiGii toxin family protein [Phytoactinopolyspora limicola]
MNALTAGWLARHTPPGAGGRYAALIDIAQDLLLAHLAERGMFDHLVFKGGTALRKLYAGNAGRFSTDLDFSVRDPDDDPNAVAELLRAEIDGQQINGFTYHVTDRRGRAHVHYDTPFGSVGNLTTKLDIGPAPWLPPHERGWIPLPIHRAYALPDSLPVMALEENMAEKIARLARRTPARDVYDLVWIATTSPHSSFDRDTVRRLAILKTWVDQYGLSSPPTTWPQVTGAVDYDPPLWRTIRHSTDYDEDSIGLLAIPAPSLDELSTQLRNHYDFLAEPDDTEQRIVTSNANGRRLVLASLTELPGACFANRPIY